MKENIIKINVFCLKKLFDKKKCKLSLQFYHFVSLFKLIFMVDSSKKTLR